MKVFTYLSTDPECPPNARAIARILTEGEGKGRKAVMTFDPVLIQAATEEDARTVAYNWWAAETTRITSARPRGRPKKAPEVPVGSAPPVPPGEDFEEEAV